MTNNNGGRSRTGWFTSLILVVSACSAPSTTAAEVVPATTTECFLGLGMWGTDPALTWIEDGRIWVRAGGHQACLAETAASSHSWSPTAADSYWTQPWWTGPRTGLGHLWAKRRG